MKINAINAINILPVKTASCSVFGDYAIAEGMTVPYIKAKRGDVVLFDFNGNGTSDHTGIIYKVANGKIYVVEGNTSLSSNDNGGCVMKRTRYKSQVNYIVRPKYNAEVTAEMVVQTALSQVGVKEKPKNSNNVKYNTWFYGHDVSGDKYPWCMVYVCWCFAHVGAQKEGKGKYKGTLPDLVQHGREKIVQVALELSYPSGTPSSKYKYGVGKPKPEYKRALNEVYPDRSSWSAQCRAGASCDVGAGTILRYAGVDKTISRALSKQIPHIQKSKIWKKTTIKSSKKMKPGDVGIYTHYGPGGHIWIGIGNGKIVEANHTAKYFLHVDNDKITSKGMKVWGIYRSQKKKALRRGDKTKQVKRLKKFLNWYGGYGLRLTNVFGTPTEKAVKDFQRRNGLKADGVFGSAELKKAKAVTK